MIRANFMSTQIEESIQLLLACALACQDMSRVKILAPSLL